MAASDYGNDVADSTFPETGQIQPSPSSVGLQYPNEYYLDLPGFVTYGGFVGQDQSYVQQNTTTEAYSWGYSSDLTTDPSVGGVPGLAMNNPVAFGGVESNNVENFELNGWQADFNKIETSNYGPTGYLDFAGVLGVSVAAGDFEAPVAGVMYADIVTGGV